MKIGPYLDGLLDLANGLEDADICPVLRDAVGLAGLQFTKLKLAKARLRLDIQSNGTKSESMGRMYNSGKYD